MDKTDSRQSDYVVDLESGNTTSTSDYEDREIKQKHRLRHLPNQRMDLDEVATQNDQPVLINTISENPFTSGEGVKMINMGDDPDSMEKKRTTMGSKKPPKPPLPPGGPSLNEADIQFVREISRLSRLRRARYERMKALKKIRAVKASSSKTNAFAMIITFLFLCVIIFQGILGSHV